MFHFDTNLAHVKFKKPSSFGVHVFFELITKSGLVGVTEIMSIGNVIKKDLGQMRNGCSNLGKFMYDGLSESNGVRIFSRHNCFGSLTNL